MIGREACFDLNLSLNGGSFEQVHCISRKRPCGRVSASLRGYVLLVRFKSSLCADVTFVRPRANPDARALTISCLVVPVVADPSETQDEPGSRCDSNCQFINSSLGLSLQVTVLPHLIWTFRSQKAVSQQVSLKYLSCFLIALDFCHNSCKPMLKTTC